jgi:hypothetical protein
MIKNIVIGSIIFFFGVNYGLSVHTKKIDAKIGHLIYLADVIKNKNNKMVQNMADIYAMSDHDESKITDVDEMLISMWMD